jgi:AcrR family transcriptional regulator
MENNLKQKIRIAAVFEKHFMHFGYKKTTVDDVALELGISKKTIYKYFQSKTDIFYFIISRHSEERRRMIEKKLQNITTAAGKLESMIEINISEFRKIWKKRKHEFIDRFQSEIASEAFREAFSQIISDIIDEGVKQGEFVVSDHDLTIRYIHALTAETIKIIQADPASRPEKELVAAIHRLLGKG